MVLPGWICSAMRICPRSGPPPPPPEGVGRPIVIPDELDAPYIGPPREKIPYATDSNPWRYQRSPDFNIGYQWEGRIVNSYPLNPDAEHRFYIVYAEQCLLDGSVPEEPGKPAGTAHCDPNEPDNPPYRWSLNGEIWAYKDTDYAPLVYRPIFIGSIRNLGTDRCLTYERQATDGQGFRGKLPGTDKLLGGITTQACEEGRTEQKFVIILWFDKRHRYNIIPYEDQWIDKCTIPVEGENPRYANRNIMAAQNGANFVNYGCGETLWEFFPPLVFGRDPGALNDQVGEGGVGAWYSRGYDDSKDYDEAHPLEVTDVEVNA